MCSQITEEADTNNYVEPHSGVMIKLIRVDTNSQPTVNKDKNQLTVNKDKTIAADETDGLILKPATKEGTQRLIRNLLLKTQDSRKREY